MIASEPTWLLPQQPPDVAADQVHVWRVWLDGPDARAPHLAQILSADEQARAARFRFERDRRRFLVGRGVLRVLLGHYLGVEPGQVQFAHGPRGKPYLAPAPRNDAGTREGHAPIPLRFNLAHSQELALVAIARQREIGVDVEWMRPLPDAEQIAARFFSACENATFQGLPAGQKIEAFYRCWTCKEAYIKAVGDGLARPLDSFDVSLAAGEPACLLRVESDADEAARWSLVTLTPAPGYAAALAVEGHGWQLVCWQFA